MKAEERLRKYCDLIINKNYCSDCNELNCLGNFPQKEIAKDIEEILNRLEEARKYIKESFLGDIDKESLQRILGDD